MDEDIMKSADVIALFYRLQFNKKRNLPIRPSEMGLLIFAHKQKDPVTPLMVSNFFKITKPSVTSMINTLIGKNYLMKIPSTTDRRSYTVSITDIGTELVQAMYNENFKTIVLLRNKMGKDFNSFIELMNKANNILSEE